MMEPGDARLHRLQDLAVIEGRWRCRPDPALRQHPVRRHNTSETDR